MRIADGDFRISFGKDGIQSDYGTETEETPADKGFIYVAGGEFQITAGDDGLNAAGGRDMSNFTDEEMEEPFASDENCVIQISGDSIVIRASGDGIDSNGSLYVSGGETYVYGPENDGNGALDYAGEGRITGGVFVASGAGGMEPPGNMGKPAGKEKIF